MSFRTQFTTLAAAATLAFAGSVEAAPASKAPAGSETMSVRVSVADLDLRQEAGVAAARNRIRRAADFVCGSQTPLSGLILYGLYHSCRDAAFDEAVAELNTRIASQSAPTETALAAAR
jgi:UrcA family protein